MNIFTEIESAHAPLGGWCSIEKATALASTVIALRPAITVEIGVFAGKSLIPMAMAHKHVNFGRIIGIDPWSNVESAKNETKENADWWGALDHNRIYTDFMAALNRLGLNGVCEIIRSPSDQVTPPPVIDLLHIDGSHTEQAVRDARRYAANVRLGGMCFMDDISWEQGGVLKAVHEIEKMGFKKLYDMDTGAMFQRL